MAGASVDISDNGKIVTIGEPLTYMYYKPYPTVKVPKYNEDLENGFLLRSDMKMNPGLDCVLLKAKAKSNPTTSSTSTSTSVGVIGRFDFVKVGTSSIPVSMLPIMDVNSLLYAKAAAFQSLETTIQNLSESQSVMELMMFVETKLPIETCFAFTEAEAVGQAICDSDGQIGDRNLKES